MPVAWRAVRDFQDIQYEHFEGIAKITINRPEVRNAFRPETVFEMLDAFADARDDPSIGVVHAHRRRRRGVLLGRRPERARRRRLRRRRRRAAAERARPAAPDPLAAQAGDRDGRRLCDRRRPRAARRLRPDDRRRQRALRADRPARSAASTAASARPAGAHRRPKEGARDLVPVPPVRRAGGAGHGPRQHGRAARPSSRTRPCSGRARCWRRARRRCAS